MENRDWSAIERGDFGDKARILERLHNKAIAKQALASPAPACKYNCVNGLYLGHQNDGGGINACPDCSKEKL